MLGRRTLLAAGSMALLVGCTSAEPRAVAAEAQELLWESEVDVVLIAEASSPVSGMSHVLTVYGDGWATLHTSAGMFLGEEDYEVHEYTLRIDGEELARVRALLADPGFASAESDYHQEHVHDGGAMIYAGGAPGRRIVVVNRPAGLPRALEDLQREALAISEKVEAKGSDPFDDPNLPARARILLRYDWWGGKMGGADRLTVFDDGLLEYRRTSPALTPLPEGDYPTPVAITRRVDPGELSKLRGLVSSRSVRTLPLLEHGRDSGADTHHFRVRGKTALRYSPSELEPPLQSIADEATRFLLELRPEL